jgi:hypothetical protein
MPPRPFRTLFEWQERSNRFNLITKTKEISWSEPLYELRYLRLYLGIWEQKCNNGSLHNSTSFRSWQRLEGHTLVQSGPQWGTVGCCMSLAACGCLRPSALSEAPAKSNHPRAWCHHGPEPKITYSSNVDFARLQLNRVVRRLLISSNQSVSPSCATLRDAKQP